MVTFCKEERRMRKYACSFVQKETQRISQKLVRLIELLFAEGSKEGEILQNG